MVHKVMKLSFEDYNLARGYQLCDIAHSNLAFRMKLPMLSLTSLNCFCEISCRQASLYFDPKCPKMTLKKNQRLPTSNQFMKVP